MGMSLILVKNIVLEFWYATEYTLWIETSCNTSLVCVKRSRVCETGDKWQKHTRAVTFLTVSLDSESRKRALIGRLCRTPALHWPITAVPRCVTKNVGGACASWHSSSPRGFTTRCVPLINISWDYSEHYGCDVIFVILRIKCKCRTVSKVFM